MKATKQIATNLGCKYIYDEWGRVNLHADRVKIGERVVVETLPTDGEIDTQALPIVRVSETKIFAFLKHCDLDFDGKEVGDIIDEMRDVAKRYIAALDSVGEFEPLPARVPYNAVLDFLDANMAGVRVTLTLKEFKGECVNV